MNVSAPPPLGYGAQVSLVAVAAAAGLAALAAFSPTDALLVGLFAVVVTFVFRQLPLGVAGFVVATFPEHLPGSLGAGATVAKPLGFVLAASWIAQVVGRRANLQFLPRDRPALSWAVIAFVSLAAISSVWATDFGQTEYEVKRLAQVAILLFVVYTASSTPRAFRSIIWAYLTGSVITATYSITTGSYGNGGRLAGLFDPNTFAAAVIPAIAISSFVLLTPGRARTRVLAAIVLVVDLSAFALTQSRGGLIGLSVALIATLFFAGRARPRFVVGVVLMAAIATAYYVEYAPAQAKARFSNISNKGSSGRSDEWRIAVHMFRDHPVLGVGLGNYPTIEPRYSTQSIDLQFVKFVVQDQLVAHNTYLELAAELGIVGLCTFLSILGLTLMRAARSLAAFEAERNELEFYARGLVAGVIGMLTAYVFFSAQYEKQLWLLLGLLAALPTLTAAWRRAPAA